MERFSPPSIIIDAPQFSIDPAEEQQYYSPSYQNVAEMNARPEFTMQRVRVAQQLETLADLRRIASPTKPIRSEEHRARVSALTQKAARQIPELNVVRIRALHHHHR